MSRVTSIRQHIDAGSYQRASEAVRELCRALEESQEMLCHHLACKICATPESAGEMRLLYEVENEVAAIAIAMLERYLGRGRSDDSRIETYISDIRHSMGNINTLKSVWIKNMESNEAEPFPQKKDDNENSI